MHEPGFDDDRPDYDEQEAADAYGLSLEDYRLLVLLDENIEEAITGDEDW